MYCETRVSRNLGLFRPQFGYINSHSLPLNTTIEQVDRMKQAKHYLGTPLCKPIAAYERAVKLHATHQLPLATQ